MWLKCFLPPYPIDMDQGLNVREKSKAIAALLSDEERLKEERKSRAALRDKMQFSGNTAAGAGSSVRRTLGAEREGPTPTTPIEEQRELERAIEESKRTAAEHERRLKEKERDDKQMQRTIEQTRSERGTAASSQPSQQQQPQKQQQQQQQLVDLWGSHPTDQRKQDLDFFTSMAAPAPAQTNQPDPFGFHSAPAPAPAPAAASNFFQSAPPQQNPYGMNGGGAVSSFAMGGNGFAQQQQQNAFAASTPAFGIMQAPSMQNAALFGGSGVAAPVSFDSSNMVPRHLQNQPPQMARNPSQIDPFGGFSTGQQQQPLPTMKPVIAATNKSSMSDLSSAFGGGHTGGSNGNVSAWTSAAQTVPNYSGNFSMAAAATAASNPANPFGRAPSAAAPAAAAGPDPFASLVPLTKSALASSATPASKPLNAQGMSGVCGWVGVLCTN